MLVGAIEAGGTKFVMSICNANPSTDIPVNTGTIPIILEQKIIPTEKPPETIDSVCSWFKNACSAHGPLESIGLASFGPLTGRYGDKNWGRLGPTPKTAWAGFDMPGAIESGLGIRPIVDTDVNAAALAEGLWGNAKNLSDYIYVTVGTGIGAGIVSGQKLIHGAGHPEAGHIPVPIEKNDTYRGYCPFHGACLEGMASGPAVAERWGLAAESIPEGHPAWELEAKYLASGFLSFVHVLACERIILGGGLGSVPFLLPLVKKHLLQKLAAYTPRLDSIKAMDNFIIAPKLGSQAGILGAAALALSYTL